MERPLRTVPVTSFHRVLEIIAGMSLAATVVLTAWRFGTLPESVPVHFDASGDPTRYATRMLVWVLPMTAMGVYGALGWLSRIPHRFNYPVGITEGNAAGQYANAVLMIRVLKAVVLGQLASLTFFQQQVALGVLDKLPIWWLPVTVGCILVTIVVFGIRGFTVNQ